MVWAEPCSRIPHAMIACTQAPLSRPLPTSVPLQVTHDISHLTCADFLRSPGVQTPVAVRFSTVIHERGSPETIRDPRGFAVKFYTREGNYDMVGNNMPVFFVRDGMKFPDMVHALKPNPKSHLQEWWRIWDFFSHHPESCHMFTFLLDDVGIPLNYRHMPGFGVHSFKLLNKAGKEVYVKFHWIPKCGARLVLLRLPAGADTHRARAPAAEHSIPRGRAWSEGQRLARLGPLAPSLATSNCWGELAKYAAAHALREVAMKVVPSFRSLPGQFTMCMAKRPPTLTAA